MLRTAGIIGHIAIPPWLPVAASISCALTRTRLPERRTLPSSTVATSSFSPTVRRSSRRPLNAKQDVRAATRGALVAVARARYSWEGVAEGVIAAAEGRREELPEPV